MKALAVARATVSEFGRNNGATLAAAIAYYTLLSIFPLILGILALLGLFFSDPATKEQFVSAVAGQFPGSEPLIQQTVNQVVEGSGTAGVVATIGLIWAASGVFAAISLALDRIWHVDQSQNPVRNAIRAVALVVAVGVIFVVSLVLSTGLRIATDREIFGLGRLVDSLSSLVSILGILVPLIITFGIFALIYGMIPDRHLTWIQIWPGAVFASVVFEAAKQAFAWYLSIFANYNAVYGSIGAVIVLVTWAYVAAIVLLMGAQLNAVLSDVTFSQGVPPTSQAKSQRIHR
jgi:membrane protein